MTAAETPSLSKVSKRNILFEALTSETAVEAICHEGTRALNGILHFRPLCAFVSLWQLTFPGSQDVAAKVTVFGDLREAFANLGGIDEQMFSTAFRRLV